MKELWLLEEKRVKWLNIALINLKYANEAMYNSSEA